MIILKPAPKQKPMAERWLKRSCLGCDTVYAFQVKETSRYSIWLESSCRTVRCPSCGRKEIANTCYAVDDEPKPEWEEAR